MKQINIKQMEIEQISYKNKYFSIIESLLFVSGEPLKLKEIANIIECNVNYTKELLEEMMLKYENDERGIKIVNVNNEFQLLTKPDNSEYVQKLLKTNVRQSLSQAALETLAIITYKQPVTRVDIEEIRGVKCDSALISLSEKGLIKEGGRLDIPGRPILYVTTDQFLIHFGMENLKQLPLLDSFLEEKQKYNEIKEEENQESN